MPLSYTRIILPFFYLLVCCCVDKPPPPPSSLFHHPPSLSSALHITEPIYLCGHIHIFIHSRSRRAPCTGAGWGETLNQDSPFKQTNEL